MRVRSDGRISSLLFHSPANASIYRVSTNPFPVAHILILVLVCIVVHHVEEPELVHALARAHDAQPVAQLLLLEVFLRPIRSRSHISPHCSNVVHPPQSLNTENIDRANSQILQVPARKLYVRNNLDLAVADLADLHHVPQVADAAVDLDAVVQELLEGGDVEDLVRGGLGGVDDELGEFGSDSVENKERRGSNGGRLVGHVGYKKGRGETYFLRNLALAAALAFGVGASLLVEK